MPNSIAYAQQFVPILDEVYKLASLTSILDGANELARQGANANELIIPKMEMDGLADYDRNGGYVDGAVIDANTVNELADIPNKETLIAKFLGSIQSPLYKFAYAIKAVVDKENGEEAPAEA